MILSSQILKTFPKSQVQLSFLDPQKLLFRKLDIKFIDFLKLKTIIMYLVIEFILISIKHKMLIRLLTFIENRLRKSKKI